MLLIEIQTRNQIRRLSPNGIKDYHTQACPAIDFETNKKSKVALHFTRLRHIDLEEDTLATTVQGPKTLEHEQAS